MWLIYDFSEGSKEKKSRRNRLVIRNNRKTKQIT
jgi:hypothetical protein